MAACDQGQHHDQPTRGPTISVTGANVSTSRNLPIDAPIQIQFDRLLLPSTVTRQSVTLYNAFNQPLTPVVTYDPVARVVTLSQPNDGAWLIKDQPYKVILHVAATDDDVGLRAIDRTPLFAGDPNREIGFLTTAPAGIAPEPRASFCNDVVPIFQRSCTAPICHGASASTSDSARFGEGGKSRPAAGLLLETSAGIASTAIGRSANGSNTGALAGQGRPAGRVFGIDMPLVDPGNPGNSWLLYKVLLAVPADPQKASPARRAKCNGTPGTKPLDPFTPKEFATGMDDFERAILNDFVLGREMPYPNLNNSGVTTSNAGLTFDELERIRLWIAQGAIVNECGACQR